MAAGNRCLPLKLKRLIEAVVAPESLLLPLPLPFFVAAILQVIKIPLD